MRLKRRQKLQFGDNPFVKATAVIMRGGLVGRWYRVSVRTLNDATVVTNPVFTLRSRTRCFKQALRRCLGNEQGCGLECLKMQTNPKEEP